MKCKNCGANLDHNYCEYCGTFYGEELRGMRMDFRSIMSEYGERDESGRLKPCEPKEILEITCLGEKERKFIEV